MEVNVICLASFTIDRSLVVVWSGEVRDIRS